MNDDEAAAVLVALGEPLRWRSCHAHFRSEVHDAYQEAPHRWGAYAVGPEESQWELLRGVRAFLDREPDGGQWKAWDVSWDRADPAAAPCWMDPVDLSPQRYTSSAAARAACGGHYATGKWE